MNDMLWLIRRTMRTTFRSPKSWIVYFALPVAGILLSLLIHGNTSGSPLRIGIVNEDGDRAVTRDAVRFVEGLEQVKAIMTDRDTLRAEIAAGRLDSGLVFGQGFADSVRAGKPEGLTVVSIKGAEVTAYVTSLLESRLGAIAAVGRETQGDQAAFEAIYADYAARAFKVTGSTLQDDSGAKNVLYQSLGYLITIMMFSAVNLSELILKEKENRTYLRLLSSPVSARSYVLSNVLVNVFIVLLQITVTLLMMKYAFRIDPGLAYSDLVPALVLFGLASVALSLLIVAFARNTAGAGAMQNLIITPTCLLAGCFFPIDIMPETVRRVASFLPQHWLLDTVNRLQNGGTPGSLYVNLLILLAFAAVFTLIAIYRFGRNNDTRMFI